MYMTIIGESSQSNAHRSGKEGQTPTFCYDVVIISDYVACITDGCYFVVHVRISLTVKANTPFVYIQMLLIVGAKLNY